MTMMMNIIMILLKLIADSDRYCKLLFVLQLLVVWSGPVRSCFETAIVVFRGEDIGVDRC